MHPTAETFPGHERDIGPAMRAVEWELTKTLHAGPVIGDAAVPNFSGIFRAAVLRHYRRRGVPAVRAYSEGDHLTVEIAEPRGYG